MKVHFSKRVRGLTLVEVVIASGIITAFLTTLITVHNTYLRSSFSNLDSVKAAYLAEEGIEAVKGIRDVSWGTNINPLIDGTTYYLLFSTTTNAWTITTIPSFIDSKFSRELFFSGVNRDTSNDITTSGGNYDHNTRKVTVSVSWADRGATTTRSMDTYITNLFAN